MRRFLVRLAVLLAIPVLIMGAVLLAANTDPGRRSIEALTSGLTSGMVRIEGLTGRFPGAIRIRRLTVADETGVWLTIDDAALDWSPRDLLHARVSIDLLAARAVTVDRLPRSTSGGSSGTSFPPVRVALSRLRLARLDIGPEVAGYPAVVTVDGSGEIEAQDTGAARLAITSGVHDQDHYDIEASVDPSRIHAVLTVAEAARGLLAGLVQLPELGATAIRASIDGPANALTAAATVAAGPLRGSLNGTVDLVSRGADLAFSVTAPAMRPAPAIRWSSVRLAGTIQGPFDAPKATGTLSADDLTAAGAGVASLRAGVAGGMSGETTLHARIDGLRVPGPSPAVLSGSPLTLDAVARLADARRPVQFTLRHALFSAEGTADTAGVEHGQVTLTLPDIAPFAAIGGVGVAGHAAVTVEATRANDTIDLSLHSSVGMASGSDPIPALIGDEGTIDLAASLRGDAIRLSRLALSGRGFNAAATGTFIDNTTDLNWTLSLGDLGVFRPGLSGAIAGHGHLGGPPAALAVTADVTGNAAGQGGHLDRLEAHIDASGLPGTPAGQLTATGVLLDAPLALSIEAEQRGNAIHLTIDRGAWKSLTAGGTLDFASGQTVPVGHVTLAMTRLADLSPLLGAPITGSATASLVASPEAAHISAVVSRAALPGTGRAAKMALEATIADPAGHPSIDGLLTVDGIEASGVRASARLTGKGPMDGVALRLVADVLDLPGGAAHVETSGALNASANTLLLASSQGTWAREPIRLLAPARIAFAQGVTIDRLRFGFRQAELAFGGSVGPGGHVLNVNATLQNLPADVVAIVAPAYAADGTISGEARLTGSTARPAGTIRVRASAVRMRSGNGRALPAADLTLGATLDGANARLDGRLTAGTSNLTLSGLAPLTLTGRMDLRVGGALDLAMLNPLLTAQGREVRGRVDLAVAVGGTPAAPRASGTVQLANGEVQDISLGAHISAITAIVQADGDTIRLTRFDGTAGPGTVSANGTFGPAGGTGPRQVDLSLRASNARLLASDLITSLVDANLALRGPAGGGSLPAALTLNGTVVARETDIRVPEQLPPAIAVLPVRDASEPPPKPPPPSSMPDVALNLTLDAPGQVYIRGRGLDVELGGRVIFEGTADRPLPQGGLKLRRGTFNLAGQSLVLTEGTIDFAGAGLTDPALKLVATSTTATATSTLTISGEVKNPKIVLSSVPDLPQDEILSELLFQSVRARLTPFQLAQVAVALASITGTGSSIGDPLESIRTRLGLDQLTVGTDANGGATLGAGRYLRQGVRLGATQSASGQSQATVQIDLAKGLKLETTAGTGSASAVPATGGTVASSGTGVGLTYEFEY
jgi:translocation and assembly module TamB